jgi:hypothetical protein
MRPGGGDHAKLTHACWRWGRGRQIAGGDKLAIPEDCPRDLAELIAQCLSTEPNDRPNFTGIVHALDALLARLLPPRKLSGGGGCGPTPPLVPVVDRASDALDEEGETRESRWRRLLALEKDTLSRGVVASSSDSDASDDDTSNSGSESNDDDDDQEEALRLVQYNLDVESVRALG